MTPSSTGKNGIRLFVFLTSFLMMASLSVITFAQSSNPQIIDFFLESGKADYVDLSGKEVLSTSVLPENLESFVIGYKAWNLIGDFVYNPSFYYEINRTRLISNSNRRIFFKTISKYPDLARRYNAIRPLSVNFVITVILRTTDSKATTVHFKVTQNNLVYHESRSPKNFQVPTSPSSGKWKYAFSTYGNFTDGDASDENELKQLLKNLRGFNSVEPIMVGVTFDIKWPAEIDEIGRLYEQYEKENKKLDDELTAIKEADKLVKPVAAYDKTDEMAAPFEEEAKSAEVFKEGKTVGLRAKGKVVFTSSEYSSAEPLNSEKNLFKFTSLKGALHLYDAKGKRLSVDENSSFWRIEEGEQLGTYRFFIVQDGNFYTTKNIYFGYPSTEKGYRTQREFDTFVVRDKAGLGGTEYGLHYTLSRGTLYTVDSKLQVLSTETVYY